jgi:hypothetical protein
VVLEQPVTAEGLIEQLRELEGIGAGGVMVVPEPPEFRPEVMKTTLSPEYLGEDYLAIYAAVTAEAARLGLNLWFYDEGGWPSGSACGKVTKAHRSSRANGCSPDARRSNRGTRYRAARSAIICIPPRV